MGYRAESGPWGTYWSAGQVYVDELSPEDAPAFLAAAQAFYASGSVSIIIDDSETERLVGPRLVQLGCVPEDRDLLLVHAGPAPQVGAASEVTIEEVDSSNMVEFARAKLKAFAGSENEPSPEDLKRELERRNAEFSGSGRGLLARVSGEVVGIIWWYEEEQDRWVNLLATRLPYRRRGVAQELLGQALVLGYEGGCRSMMINVEESNEAARRLYARLGFTELVYWRQWYILSDDAGGGDGRTS
jgi:ribosomal protein S18 acetylase RimI-like enzyme